MQSNDPQIPRILYNWSIRALFFFAAQIRPGERERQICSGFCHLLISLKVERAKERKAGGEVGKEKNIGG